MKYTHKDPRKMWPTRWLWADRSDEPKLDQIIDILIDIRNLVLLFIILWSFL